MSRGRRAANLENVKSGRFELIRDNQEKSGRKALRPGEFLQCYKNNLLWS